MVNSVAPSATHIDIGVINAAGNYNLVVRDASNTIIGSTSVGVTAVSLVYSIFLTSPPTSSVKVSVVSTGLIGAITLSDLYVPRDTLTAHTVVSNVYNRDGYQYGYNGKLKDNEWAGLGNHYDYGARHYDSRIARFISVDPLAQDFPMLTPYQYASNSPIKYVDLDGLEGADIKYESPYGVNFIGGSGVDKDAYNESYNGIVMPAATAVATEFVISETLAWIGLKFFTRSASTGSTINTTKTVVKTEGQAAQTVTKAKTVTQNAQQGAKFEQKVATQAMEEQTDVVQQVTIKTKSGTKTKVDVVGTNKKTGKIELTEAKSSQTAPLTKNQKRAFPEIEQSGGTVVGKGKPPYPGGTKIPATKVKVVRPPQTGQ